jgi:hypothetical protein
MPGKDGNRTEWDWTVTGHAEQDGKRIDGTRTVTQLDKIRVKIIKAWQIKTTRMPLNE